MTAGNGMDWTPRISRLEKNDVERQEEINRLYSELTQVKRLETAVTGIEHTFKAWTNSVQELKVQIVDSNTFSANKAIKQDNQIGMILEQGNMLLAKMDSVLNSNAQLMTAFGELNRFVRESIAKVAKPRVVLSKSRMRTRKKK